MEWMYFNSESTNTAEIPPLGYFVGEKFQIDNGAQKTLNSMLDKMKNEDKLLRTFRRSMGFLQTIRKDVAPIITSGDHVEKDVFYAAVRVLSDFTTPLECLFSTEEVCSNEEGQQTVFELQQHLSETKGLFLDQRLPRNIMEVMEKTLTEIHEKMDKCATSSTMKSDNQEDLKFAAVLEECRSISSCITLFRNVLHISEDLVSRSSSPSSSSSNQKAALSSRQNHILWNLFCGNLDTVILKMISNPCMSFWCTSLMQLIALIYKDQHVITMQRLLAAWLETEISESSEDNESNTSPQNGSCSSPILTSNEADDSSSDSSNSTNAKSLHEGSCHADASSNVDSGNETSQTTKNPPSSPNVSTLSIPKSSSTLEEADKKEIAIEDNNIPRESEVVKDVEMQSDNSENLVQEPPTKKLATSTLVVQTSRLAKKKKAMDKPRATIPKTLTPRRSPPDKSKRKVASIKGESASLRISSATSNARPRKVAKSKVIKAKKESCKEDTSGDVSSGGTKITGKKVSPPMLVQPMTASIGVQQGKKCETNLVAPKGDGGRCTASESTSGGSISDYGYGSQPTTLETQENVSSTSTSSNDDDLESKRNVTPHTNLQKPRPKKPIISPAERREIRRRRLIKRAKSQRMKAKAMLHHNPTDEDIAELLKEFTVDFLLKGYSTFAKGLREQFLLDQNFDLDKSHFLWLITYFLKFASQLEVEIELISPILSVATITYLTFEGVRLFEDLELATRERTQELKPHLRRMHLVMTAIHEFILTLDNYLQFTHFSKEDTEKLVDVRAACFHACEIRQLFLLLIRRFDPQVQSRQFLRDVICGNHSLLVLIENVNQDSEVMKDHVSQFATVEVMRQYGHLLEDFRSNSDAINEAIFTMMHHISGDLQKPEALFVPQILKTFSEIWNLEDCQICEDWSDLIEYVIQKFINTMGSRPHACAAKLIECLDTSDAVDENGFSKQQLDNLYHYYSQCQHSEDPVGGIIDIYRATYSVNKTRLCVIQALLSQGIITHAQYMGLMYMKSVLASKPCHEGSVVAEAGSEHYDSDGHEFDGEQHHRDSSVGERELHHQPAHHKRQRDQVDVLKELLQKQGKEYLLQWLQKMLLDTCQVKLNTGNILNPDGIVQEPVPFYYNYINQSIPLVPWNKQMESGLQSETFILLLHKLGFHLAADVGKCFPRIPHFWSADHLLQMAQKLGPIQAESVTFDVSMLMASSVDSESICSSSIRSADEIMDEGDFEMSNATTTKMELAPKEDILIPSTTNALSVLENNTFALPTPTNSWLQMALMSKRIASNSSEVSQVVSSSLSSGLITSLAAATREVTRITQSTSMVSSVSSPMVHQHQHHTANEERKCDEKFERMQISEQVLTSRPK